VGSIVAALGALAGQIVGVAQVVNVEIHVEGVEVVEVVGVEVVGVEPLVHGVQADQRVLAGLAGLTVARDRMHAALPLLAGHLLAVDEF